MIISASLADQLWPGRDAVGRKLAIQMYDGITPTIVGVVNDIHLPESHSCSPPWACSACSPVT